MDEVFMISIIYNTYARAYRDNKTIPNALIRFGKHGLMTFEEFLVHPVKNNNYLVNNIRLKHGLEVIRDKMEYVYDVKFEYLVLPMSLWHIYNE